MPAIKNAIGTITIQFAVGTDEKELLKAADPLCDKLRNAIREWDGGGSSVKRAWISGLEIHEVPRD